MSIAQLHIVVHWLRWLCDMCICICMTGEDPPVPVHHTTQPSESHVTAVWIWSPTHGRQLCNLGPREAYLG